MSTNCQEIVDRARSASKLNTGLTSDTRDMLTRIRAIQQRVFAAIAGLSRDRFRLKVAASSSSAARDRTVSLSASAFTVSAGPIQRVLRVQLPDGTDVNQVDELDVEAEFAPRFFVRGTDLVEVGNDWGTAGVVPLTVTYLYGQSPIDITAGLSSQGITVPDEWCDVVILPLAMYLHQIDPGRDPLEYDRLKTLYEGTWADFVAYLTGYGGVESRRFQLPTPPETGKR